MTTKEKQTQKALAPKTGKAVVKWKGEHITVTFQDVKSLICPLATDQEIVIFLRTCQSLQLNPFAKEIYLIKYGEKDKAATVIAIDSYLKSAETNDNFSGFEAGIVLKDSGGKLEFREGAFLLDDEMDKLVGGWARVYRKDRERPFYIAVNKAECLRYTREGNLTKFWTKEKQPSMLRKTGLKRALVETFPSLFAGTLSNVEADYEVMPEDVREVVPTPKGETPEGEVPPGFQKNGKTDWRKLYGKLRSELGVSPEQGHELIGAESFNDLKADGWTEEQIFDAIVTAQQQQKATEAEPERVVDTQTGEIISQEEDLFGERAEEAGAAPQEVMGDEKTSEIERQHGAAPAKLKRDPETIISRNGLLSACFHDYNMQPQAVAKELGYRSQSEITGNFADYYRTIAAVRQE